MSTLTLNLEKIYDEVTKKSLSEYENKVKQAITALHEKTGKGSDYLGWINLPSSVEESHLTEIEQLASQLKEKIEILVVIGIGGSYLGAKAVSEAFSHSFSFLKDKKDFPRLIFAGQNIGEDYLSELLEVLDNKKYGIVVISKSGTTTEPAIAFRILREHLENRVGKENVKNYIIAITDAEKGALRTLAEREGYKSFVIPGDVGGRYSVLTPVGLVPLAIGGFSVRELVRGAMQMEKRTKNTSNFWENPSAVYAATRHALYSKGKKIEILVNYDPKLHYLTEWWKQLFGESEGKEGKGIFPAGVDFTTDLHSMGQYIQEGERILFETVISVKTPQRKLTVPHDEDNLDNLNYLKGKRIDEVNKMAALGTTIAHIEGNVPNILIEIAELNEYNMGQIMYFFEKACGISGYLLGINPFDQPGVEAYKKNMFALLEKPGYEKETKIIKSKL